MLDILIIGGGPAGLTAGIYAMRAGLRTLLVEGSIAGGQAVTTSHIENYPGFADGIGGPELMMAMVEQAEKTGLAIRYAPAELLELSGPIKRALIEDEWIEAKCVVLCMGAKPRRTGAPGEDTFAGRGVSFCATCDGAFYRGKRVAVIGGGNSAAEEALYLANIAENVTLIHRRDQLRADGIMAQRVLSHPNISVRWNSAVETFEGDTALRSLRLRDTAKGASTTLPMDGAFLSIGRDPDTKIAQGKLKMDDMGFILAGEDTRTSEPGVFAAGDLRQKPLRQVVTAVADGAVAISEALKWMAQGEGGVDAWRGAHA